MLNKLAVSLSAVLLIIASSSCAETNAAELNTGSNADHTAFEGVFVLKETPETRSEIKLTIFLKSNFINTHGEEPSYDVFISLIGDGHIPETETYHMGNGFGWKFVKWLNLPYEVPVQTEQFPFTKKTSSIEFQLSHVDITSNQTEIICVSVSSQSLIIERDCKI